MIISLINMSRSTVSPCKSSWCFLHVTHRHSNFEVSLCFKFLRLLLLLSVPSHGTGFATVWEHLSSKRTPRKHHGRVGCVKRSFLKYAMPWASALFIGEQMRVLSRRDTLLLVANPKRSFKHSITRICAVFVST